MLPEKSINAQSKKQKAKFVTVIHPEKLTAVNTEEKNKTLLNREALVSWLFLIGSILFLFDGLIELTEGLSIHVVNHLIASILFTVGSILFIPWNNKN